MAEERPPTRATTAERPRGQVVRRVAASAAKTTESANDSGASELLYQFKDFHACPVS